MILKNYHYVLLCSAIVLLAGCKQRNLPEHEPVKVHTEPVRTTTLQSGITFSGTVEEASGSTLSFPVAGTVEQIYVSEGQRVQKGQLIAILNDASIKSAHEASVAMLEQAQDAYERLKMLHDSNSLPEIQWIEVQSKLKQAQSAERVARKNLEDSKLYAPYSGVISEKSVDRGHNVLPGMPVVNLVVVNPVKINVSVPENEIANISVGQPVKISVSALNGKIFDGKIAEKGIAANPLTRSYEVKALVVNQGEDLMPGMICTLSLDSQENTSAITLPINIIQRNEQNQTFVWVNKKGKATKRIISLGTIVENDIVVTSGLSEDDEIIVSGQQKISGGMEITVVK